MAPRRRALLTLIALSSLVTPALAQEPGPGTSTSAATAPSTASAPDAAPSTTATTPDAPDFRFFPSRLDVDAEGRQRPLGDRVPVVVVHGYSRWYVTLLDLAMGRTWSGLRAALGRARQDPALSLDDVKIYYYGYRPTKPYPELAAEMADRVIPELFGDDAPAERKVIFLAHSAGTLMSRYTAADPRLEGRVAGILTLAGIHRGSVQASLVTARNLLRRPGVTREHVALLDSIRRANVVDPRVYAEDPEARIACDDDPSCRVLASLAFDNYDGSIRDQDIRDFGFLANDALRAFHRLDPNVGRIYAFHADVATFGTVEQAAPVGERLGGFLGFGAGRERPRPQVPTDEEAERRAIAAIHPAWANADPLVTYQSGTFQDAPCPLGGCRTYRPAAPDDDDTNDVDHKGILSNARVMDEVVRQMLGLAALARAGQEDRFLDWLRELGQQVVDAARGVVESPALGLGFFGQGSD